MTDSPLCLTPLGALSCMKPSGHAGDCDHRAWPWPGQEQHLAANVVLGVVQPPERKPTTLVQGLPPWASLTPAQRDQVTAWLLDDDDLRTTDELLAALDPPGPAGPW